MPCMLHYIAVNPLNAMGIFFNKQNFLFEVLAPSNPHINSYGLMEGLDTLILCVRGWLSVNEVL